MKVCQRCQNRFQSSDWTCTQCGFIPNKPKGFAAFAEELSNDSGCFDPARMAMLYKVESGNFWFRARNHLILSSIPRFFPAAKTFLEVGCGTGFVLSGIRKAYPDLTMTGAELLDAGLEFASQRVPDAELIQMDARAMPFDQEFDLIGSFDVLEHINEDEQVLRQFNGALVDGGGLILTVPQHMWLWSQHDVDAHHCRRYSSAELAGKLQRNGFEIVFMSSFVSFLLPAFYLSRMIHAPARRQKWCKWRIKNGWAGQFCP